MPTGLSSPSSPGISSVRCRLLGRCGLTVSEIGFGTWGLGGTHEGAIAYGPTDDEESLLALRYAFERGVIFYDTADLYGHGHSESLLGRAFGFHRRDVVIATKAGFLTAGTQDFSPAYLEKALWQSLRRLQTDYVDVFLLHSPPLEQIRSQDRMLAILEGFKRQGSARAVGVSVRSPEDGRAVALDGGVDVLEVNFNLTDQRALDCGLFDICSRQSIGLIVRTPLCFGFLTGTVDEATTFDARDHRCRWSIKQRSAWHQAQKEFGSCASAIEEQTPAQLALRFCLSYPAVSTVIPGMLTKAHVEENLRASTLGPLPVETRQGMEARYRQRNFFVGK